MWLDLERTSLWTVLRTREVISSLRLIPNKPCHENTGIREIRRGPTQTDLFSHRRSIEAGNFGFLKKSGCTIREAKAKTLISCALLNT